MATAELKLVDGSVSDRQGVEYLTFSLAGEEYGVDILRVREIRGWEVVTRIPNGPPYVKGVLNLRGAIVPIIDLRERFDMPHVAYNPCTVVIVLQVMGGNHTSRIMGVVVDSVSDVLTAQAEDIKVTPQFGSAIDTQFISGLADANGRMIMLLDVDRLLNDEQLSDGLRE
jgi:purine-binding chemotaxis protein CheW